MLTGCAQPHVARYQQVVAADARNFDALRIDMTMDEVGYLDRTYDRFLVRREPPARVEPNRIDPKK